MDRIRLRIYEDNQAALSIVSSGYSPKLRRLSKTHRINVTSTFIAITENTDVSAEHVGTACQKADIMNHDKGDKGPCRSKVVAGAGCIASLAQSASGL